MSEKGPPNAPPNGAPPGESKSMNASFVDTDLVVVAVMLPILSTIATVLRFYATRLIGFTKFKADDWTLILTVVFCWAHSINTLVAGAIGGINTIEMSPWAYANIALRTLWISSFFLITSLYTVKVSILLFYLRIFSVKEGFRKAIIVMIVILTLWWASSIVLVFLSTDPIEAAWKNADATKHHYNFNKWYISYSGLSIILDITILCFPIPMIKSLNTNLKQKISILGIFWLGAFVCVSAIVRFVYLYKSIYRLTDYGENQYSSITTAFIWAEVEPNTAVIAACLPTFRPLFSERSRFVKIIRFLRMKTRNFSNRTANSSDMSDSQGKESEKSDHGLKTAVRTNVNNDLLTDSDMKRLSSPATTTHDTEAQQTTEWRQ